MVKHTVYGCSRPDVPVLKVLLKTCGSAKPVVVQQKPMSLTSVGGFHASSAIATYMSWNSATLLTSQFPSPMP